VGINSRSQDDAATCPSDGSLEPERALVEGEAEGATVFELPKPAAGMPLKSLGAGTPTVELCGGPAAEATKPPIDAGKAQVAVLVHAATVQRLASEPEAVSGQQKAAGDGDQAPGRAQLPVDAQVRSRLRR